jgi:hypothetical protein
VGQLPCSRRRGEPGKRARIVARRGERTQEFDCNGVLPCSKLTTAILQSLLMAERRIVAGMT